MPVTACVGSFADRIHLLCYGYDPVRGIYTERITTMLEYRRRSDALGDGWRRFSLMTRRERRRAAS